MSVLAGLSCAPPRVGLSHRLRHSADVRLMEKQPEGQLVRAGDLRGNAHLPSSFERKAHLECTTFASSYLPSPGAVKSKCRGDLVDVARLCEQN